MASLAACSVLGAKESSPPCQSHVSSGLAFQDNTITGDRPRDALEVGIRETSRDMTINLYIDAESCIDFHVG